MSSRTPLPPITISSGAPAVIGLVNNKLVNQEPVLGIHQVPKPGLELGFLNSRLTAEMDYYDRLTKGIIQGSHYPTC